MSNTTILEISDLHGFKKAWAAIQQRAAKLGLPVPTAREVGPAEYKVCKVTTAAEGLDGENQNEWMVEVTPIEITTFPIALAGWVLVGVVEPISHRMNLVMKVNPEWPGELEQFRTVDLTCDHCQSLRNRSKVYIVGNVETAELMQVGKSCVKDFMPSPVTNMLAAFEFQEYLYRYFAEEREESMFGARRGVSAISVSTVLNCALSVVESLGYTSRTKERDTGAVSTTTIVTNQVMACEMVLTCEEEADAMLQWAKQHQDPSSYWTSVQAFLNEGKVPVKRLGYIVGIVGCYRAEQAKLLKQAHAKDSQWVGTVGVRRPFVATIKRVSSFEGNFGLGYITLAIDDDGNLIKYWNRLGQEGERVSFSAGVKEHEIDSRNQAQVTVITRATKIVTVGPASKVFEVS